MTQRILTPLEASTIQTALNGHGATLIVDGHFGELSRLALLRFQHVANLAETGQPDDATLAALGIPNLLDRPAPSKKPNLNIFQTLGTIMSLVKFLKGLKMDSSANVDVKSAWFSTKNWAAGIAILTNIAAFFHIAIPEDLAPTVVALVDSATALYILVKNTWFTSSITAASAKKL